MKYQSICSYSMSNCIIINIKTCVCVCTRCSIAIPVKHFKISKSFYFEKISACLVRGFLCISYWSLSGFMNAVCEVCPTSLNLFDFIFICTIFLSDTNSINFYVLLWRCLADLSFLTNLLITHEIWVTFDKRKVAGGDNLTGKRFTTRS